MNVCSVTYVDVNYFTNPSILYSRLRWLINDLTTRCRSFAVLSGSGYEWEQRWHHFLPCSSWCHRYHTARCSFNNQRVTLWERRQSSYPLDFHALCPVHVVAFTVCGVIVSVCWGGRLKILGILCQLEFFGLLPWLVAELYQCHGHSQAKPSNQNIEDSRHIAQA